ncbi:metallo-beta-lactamase superfamily protein [Cordyceps javanica]|uniref:Metallo-beta-lactamase superfamily protein n=1 Tax=Cordyceps javanica TaxID=43265 RepID=A0A545VY63_9HYPO|nr:metallo-beta-lactamase superfamily protein [Cordyceps javanica]TQW06625.1 metallo-beta-lactamase superfamily protein [Cordyceps javanica]
MVNEFRIPESSNTVSVSIINSTSKVTIEADKIFANPHPNHPILEVPNFSFVIQHEAKNYTILFDLGLRKDFLNAAPIVSNVLRSGESSLTVEKDVHHILKDGGLSPSTVNAAVWSHWHIDHIGDPSLFHHDMKLIVGPGFRENFLPGYPANEESMVLASDFENRELEELDFMTETATRVQVGQFDAIDYFEDGSLYFLNAPGHTIGHIAALARVQSAPDSFILMAADGCIHGGQLRPSPAHPLPAAARSSSLELGQEDVNANHDQRPFYRAARNGVSHDADLADKTIQFLQDADARDDVFVVFSHDKSLLDVVDFFRKRQTTLFRKVGPRNADGNF